MNKIKMQQMLATGLAGAMAAGFACSAGAQGSVNTEISTAHAHALMAQSATMVRMAHTHLQHVINCLVGPEGPGFDAAAGNPCKGQGSGAINDTKSGTSVHDALQGALETAKRGLQSTSLDEVRDDAGKVATTLQDATTATSGAPASPATSQ